MNIERTLEPVQAAGSELGPIGRPTSVADEVYRSIRAAIVHQRLRPGQRVTEAGLAKGFDVSKTPVREALLRLHEVGLVSLSAAGQGAHVVGEADDAVQKACEVRAVLERGAAALAAKRRSEADLEVLTAAAEATVTCARAGDVGGFAAQDAKFHLGVAHAAQNDRLSKLVFDNLDLVAALRSRAETLRAASVECALAHRWVLEAIVNQQPEEAACRMEQHVRKAGSVTSIGPEIPEISMPTAPSEPSDADSSL